MEQLLKHMKNGLERMIFILVCLVLFQNNVSAAPFGLTNLGLNPNEAISETHVQGEIEDSSWVEFGFLWIVSKDEVGVSGEVFRSEVGDAAKSSGRVFWSGGSQARVAAESFAKSNGLKTLEMTWQGKALTRLTNATSYKLTAPLWNRASASFARGATGPVNVFHNGVATFIRTLS